MEQTKSAQNTLDIVVLLEQYEALLGNLYEAFSRIFPEKKPFWLAIAADEAEHARLAKKLSEYATQGLLRLKPNTNLDTEYIARELENIKMYIETVSQHSISYKRALGIAKILEEGVLEHGLPDIFDTDNPEAKKIIDTLHEMTIIHLSKLEHVAAKRDQFGQLIEKGIVTDIQVELARSIASNANISTESVLMSRFKVARNDLLQSLKNHFNVPHLNLKDMKLNLPPETIKIATEKYDIMKSKAFVPAEIEEKTLKIIMANPLDLYLRDDIQRMFSDYSVDFFVGIIDDVLEAIDRIFPEKKLAREFSFNTLLQDIEDDKFISVKDEEEISEEDSTIVKLVNLIIEDAFKKRASDIHFETSPDSNVMVRCRIDGLLSKMVECPHSFGKAIISRLKIMSNLDIAEKRNPQSGKIRYKRWGKLDLELRVETYPTFGDCEDAVLRILSSKKPLSFEELSMNEANIGKLKTVVAKPYGLFLCVGPTGSGKTTTLHSALSYINDEKVKILTVEDPIEIVQKGLRQVQVNRKAGMKFGEALRSFLRADPDIIMVGEMRDFETANIAIEASLTGHLVMSTLHTNSAAETITRLLEIGLDPYTFSDSMLGVLAQRLLRKLCPDCKIKVKDPKKEITILKKEYAHPERFEQFLKENDPVLYTANPGGCEECSSGYKDRMAIHEFLISSDVIRGLITSNANSGDIFKTAVEEGMTTLKQDGIEKILKGHTTLDEVLAVCSR